MGVEQGQNIISTSVHQNIVHKYKLKVDKQNQSLKVDTLKFWLKLSGRLI